jgi:hypothetical protein
MVVATDQRGAGDRQALLGPTMCTIPLPSLPMSKSFMPNFAVFSRRPRSSGAPGGKVSSVRPGWVEIAWSGVA